MNRLPAVFASTLLAFCALQSATGQIPSWGALLDDAGSNPSLEPARNALVVKAREAAALPIYRRAKSLAEVGQNRTWLDGRSESLEPEIKEQFALAMSDFGACNGLAEELPTLAAGYRITRDPALLARIVAQLEEMSTWSPLQRPGWTLYTPGHRLPAEGKDGNWLATGCGVRAIGDTIDLLPAGSLSPELTGRLHALLEAEIAGVVDDWQTKRSWFIRSDNPNTNQWVLPTEGLVRACLILGVDQRRDAYELGVANLLRSFDAHGAHGEFEEGFGYARFTVTSMLHAAHAMAVTGDRRALDHPFLKHFPLWFVHHFQPANMVINCFDAGPAYGAAEASRPFLSLAALCTGSSAARWALANQVGGPSDDLAGLAARALPPVGPEAAPVLFTVYERAARVNWRDSWDANASGVWVRGGHALDQHDHQDRGHVNFISHGQPILIEAGTPSYHHKLMMTHYSSGVGHNVLQLGTEDPEASSDPGKNITHPGWQKVHTVAPITVKRLDIEGGETQVDGKSCYDGLAKWDRNVAWTSDKLTVTDDVALAEGTTNVVLFRWHLATEGEVAIAGEGMAYTVTLPGARITLTADKPVTIKQVKLPDNTLQGHDGSEDPKNFHTCLVVQTPAQENALLLTTKVETE